MLSPRNPLDKAALQECPGVASRTSHAPLHRESSTPNFYFPWLARLNPSLDFLSLIFSNFPLLPVVCGLRCTCLPSLAARASVQFSRGAFKTEDARACMKLRGCSGDARKSQLESICRLLSVTICSPTGLGAVRTASSLRKLSRELGTLRGAGVVHA